MDKDSATPFKVGESVEFRCFDVGFRVLSYKDYTHEKEEWTELYQTPPPGWAENQEKQLMLRPQYPRIFQSAEEAPPIDAILEVILVRDRDWKVGDLVDWFEEGCYWSAKVTQIFGGDEAAAIVELPPPPRGEGFGKSYRALLSDLRPSLDWSPESGWTVPTSEDEDGNFLSCARLVYPVDIHTVVGEDGLKDVPISIGLTPDSATDLSSVQPGYPENEEMHQNPAEEKVMENPKTSNSLMDFEELSNKLTWLGKILKSGMSSSNAGTSGSWEFFEQHHGSSVAPK
ncbi:OLC1v1005080C1 [Oldenlandia corymbosa var. corymbosa]|uniref:OLC1v1005080C1 n=1 Tax=Oldenlandia corymbosa var. corymbosa TaxID=529605 RepID=A0AAV1DED4_OLDCO|nr:OLC1v1005080C1 [Oldenlandia corymbosa var. corymbosa]